MGSMEKVRWCVRVARAFLQLFGHTVTVVPYGERAKMLKEMEELRAQLDAAKSMLERLKREGSDVRRQLPFMGRVDAALLDTARTRKGRFTPEERREKTMGMRAHPAVEAILDLGAVLVTDFQVIAMHPDSTERRIHGAHGAMDGIELFRAEIARITEPKTEAEKAQEKEA